MDFTLGDDFEALSPQAIVPFDTEMGTGEDATSTSG